MSVTPLSQHAIGVLADLRRWGPCARQIVNPGVCRVIEDRGLVETFMAPTPYRTKTGFVQWLRITEAGIAAVIAAGSAGTGRL